MVPAQSTPAAPAGPLSSDQLGQVAAAYKRARKVRRVVGVARFSAWTTAVFGGLTLLGGFFATSALVLGLGMVFCGWNELRAAEQVRRLDPRGCTRLALNQLILFGFLALYCMWNIISALRAPHDAISVPGADEILQSANDMARGISVIVYAAAIALSALVQGLTALYYHGKARLIRDYIHATPGWVIEVQKAA